jgi:hypothetical protein
MVQAFFAVNVPFVLPVAEFGLNEEFKVFGASVVLFKPHEWRGTTCTPKPNCPTSADLAQSLSSLPKGTVTHLYTTTDGGLHYPDIIQMIAGLDEHVELVHHVDLVEMALASRGQ